MENFPATLKGPILRTIQFSTIPRLDMLVDQVYHQFKNEFFPGDVAMAKINDRRVTVIVREKAKFNAVTLPYGERRPSYCSCRVERVDTGEEVVLDEVQLVRERKAFTKNILSTFIKCSVYQDFRLGAFWLVKDEFAQFYGINPVIPPELMNPSGNFTTHDLNQFRLETHEEQRLRNMRTDDSPLISSSGKTQPDLYNLLGVLAKQSQLREAQIIKSMHQKELHQIRIQQKELQLHQQQLLRDNSSQVFLGEQHQVNLNYNYSPSISEASYSQNGNYINHEKIWISSGPLTEDCWSERNPGSSKTIQDDLLFPYNQSNIISRPQLKKCSKIKPLHAINALLETWLFLNTYSQPLVLDTFTFDCYLDTLNFDEVDVGCDLLNEIHCSLLCALMGTKKAELLIQLPKLPEDYHTSDCEDNDLSPTISEAETVHNPDTDVKEDLGDDNESKIDDRNQEITPVPETNKSKLYSNYKKISWKERLRRRMFKDGGWQLIIIGLLDSLIYVPDWKESINRILDILAPLDQPLALFTVYQAYMESLSLELRVEIIRILCELLHSSQIVREHIDKCMEQSARIRKDRLDNLRQCKALFDTIKGLEEQKKAYFPNGVSQIASLKPDVLPVSNGKAATVSESLLPFMIETKRPALMSSVSQERKKRKKDVEIELAKTDSLFRKIYTMCESAKDQTEALLEANRLGEQELAVMDCQRAKMIGKDRYHNRYWWFEGNGLKVVKEEKEIANSISVRKEEGDSELGYLMGRLWVQGPTNEDAQLYLGMDPPRKFPDISKDEKGHISINNRDVSFEYMSHFTAAERKVLEEGELCLTSNEDWGYYDKPDDIEALIKWLNPQGQREIKLSREIMAIKKQICDSMNQRKDKIARDVKLQEKELINLREKNAEFTGLSKSLARDRRLISSLEKQLLNIRSESEHDAAQASPTESQPNSGSKKQPVADQLRRRSARLQRKTSDTTPVNHSKGPTESGLYLADSKRDLRVDKDLDKPKTRNGMSDRQLVSKLEDVQKRVQEYVEELQEMENEISRHVETSRMLSWKNGLAEETLGHSFFESLPLKAKSRKNGRNKK